MQIPLSAYRNQKVRVFTLDSDGKVLASANFEIVKEYIEDVQIDPDMIVFEGVTESERKDRRAENTPRNSPTTTTSGISELCKKTSRKLE